MRTLGLTSGLARLLAAAVASIAAWLSPGFALGAIPMVSVEDHAIALTRDGVLYAWGRNDLGQVGDGTLSPRPSPSRVSGLPPLRSALAITGSTYGITQAGDVFEWGINGGRAPRSMGLSGVVAAAAGSDLIFLRSDGTVLRRPRYDRGSPAVVPGLSGITAVAGGFNHQLAVGSDGSIWAWGGNSYGELGVPAFAGSRTTPEKIAGLSGAIAVSAGFQVSFALKRDGTVWGWGGNFGYELGDGTNISRHTPAQVPGLANIVAISSYGSDTIAIRADGVVFIWGSTLGEVTRAPKPVEGVSRIVAGAMGNGAVILVRDDGALFSFGADNRYGQLGYGDFGVTSRTRIYQVATINVFGAAGPNAPPTATFTFRTDVAGGAYSVVADASRSFDPEGPVTSFDWRTGDGRTASGTTATFAFNGPAAQAIELVVRDAGGAEGRTSAVVLPPRAANVPMIATDGGTVLALRNDGVAFGWGANHKGQAGTGTLFDNSVPKRLAALNGVRAIATSGRLSLAARDDGTAWSWGSNLFGELGIGTTTGRAMAPVQVLDLQGVVSVATGFSAGFALKSDGTVWQWGNIPDENGIGRARVRPQQVVGLAGVSAIFGAGFHQLALQPDGSLWAWGSNNQGQHGFGSTSLSQGPVQLPIQSVVDASAGAVHSLAVKSDGTLWIWGDNRQGGLGIGSSLDFVPVTQVPGITGVLKAAACTPNVLLMQDGTVREFGEGVPLRTVTGLGQVVQISCTAALKSDGTVWTWGRNDYGQLGNGTYVVLQERLAPGIVLNEDGGGSLDADNWYLDLVPAVAGTIPASAIPNALSAASLKSVDGGAALGASIRYRAAEFGRGVKNYVVGVVPPGFLDLVKRVPGTPDGAGVRAKLGEGSVLVQLTPSGWATVDGQLVAYSHGVANAAGGAANILDRINLASIPGARFCIGYGETPEAMLTSESLRDVLVLEGAAATSSRLPCVLSGVYVSGPPTSRAGTVAGFSAAVVGLSPTGQVQFQDNGAGLGAPVTLSIANEAVSGGSTQATLSAGVHSITAAYSGDSQNAAATSVLALRHEVVSISSGAANVALSGPARSLFGEEVAFVAVVTGNSPGGTIQFRDGAQNLGDPVPVVEGTSVLRVSTLSTAAHTITAAYSGDGNNQPSNSNALVHQVGEPFTPVILSPSSTSPEVGQQVTLTASLQGVAPTGTVTFLDADVELGSAGVSGSTASFSISRIARGPHYFSARYAGDGANPAGNSPTVYVAAFVAAQDADEDSDGIPNGVEIIEGRDPFTKDNDIFGNARLFAMQQYRDFLGREGDAGGVGYWASQLTLGVQDRAQMVETFFTSAEFQGLGAPIARLYFAYFLRIPDYDGLNYWIGQFRSGNSLEGISNAFAASPEFQLTYGSLTNLQFVSLVYQNILGRAPDAGGLSYWTGQVNAGMTRGQLMVAFSESPEYRSLIGSEIFVTMMYIGMLRREPDLGGFNFWVGYKDAGNSGLDLIRGFLSSLEYRRRFLP